MSQSMIPPKDELLVKSLITDTASVESKYIVESPSEVDEPGRPMKT